MIFSIHLKSNQRITLPPVVHAGKVGNSPYTPLDATLSQSFSVCASAFVTRPLYPSDEKKRKRESLAQSRVSLPPLQLARIRRRSMGSIPDFPSPNIGPWTGTTRDEENKSGSHP